jgi:hypothetical protein
MSETWKPIREYDGFYEASSLGRIRSVDRDVVYSNGKNRRFPGKILKPTKDRDGYEMVTLSKSNRHKTKHVHRLVAEAFLGPCQDDMQCAHNDGNPSNNRIENIRWATPSENQRDRLEHGTSLRGESHPDARLSEMDVLLVRHWLKKDKYSLRQIADAFDMSIGAIFNIKAGRSWAWLEEAS